MRSSGILLIAAAAASLGCRYDPIPQDIIDGLGEEKGSPSATHRPGEPCLACHSTYGGAEPAFAVAGTVFGLTTTGDIAGAPNILVNVLDSAGQPQKACSNAAGNFYVLKENWADVTYPLSATAGDRQMHSLIGRDGSCATCHKLPDDDSLDPLTGASRDSAGVILVDPLATDPTCGGGS